MTQGQTDSIVYDTTKTLTFRKDSLKEATRLDSRVDRDIFESNDSFYIAAVDAKSQSICFMFCREFNRAYEYLEQTKDMLTQLGSHPSYEIFKGIWV